MQQALIIFAIFLTANVVFAQISATANVEIRSINDMCYPKVTDIEKVDNHTIIAFSQTIIENNTYENNFYLLVEEETIVPKVTLPNEFEVIDSYVLDNCLYFCGKYYDYPYCGGFMAKAYIPDFFTNGQFSFISFIPENIPMFSKIVAYKNNDNEMNIACLSYNHLVQYNEINAQCIIDTILEISGCSEDYLDLIEFQDKLVVAGNYHNIANNQCGWNLRFFDKNNIGNNIGIHRLTRNYDCHMSKIKLEKYEDANTIIVVTDQMSYNNNSNGGLSVFLVDLANHVDRYDMPTLGEYTYLWDVSFTHDGNHKNLLALTYDGGNYSSVYHFDFAAGHDVIKYRYPRRNMLTSIKMYTNDYFITIGKLEDNGHTMFWDRRVFFREMICDTISHLDYIRSLENPMLFNGSYPSINTIKKWEDTQCILRNKEIDYICR